MKAYKIFKNLKMVKSRSLAWVLFFVRTANEGTSVASFPHAFTEKYRDLSTLLTQGCCEEILPVLLSVVVFKSFQKVL